jgi:hypothetical protein
MGDPCLDLQAMTSTLSDEFNIDQLERMDDAVLLKEPGLELLATSDKGCYESYDEEMAIDWGLRINLWYIPILHSFVRSEHRFQNPVNDTDLRQCLECGQAFK